MSILNKLFEKKHGDGETPEFKALLDGSMEGLLLQTEAHQGTWRLGKSERWDFSQDSGELVFTFPDMVARAPAQIIGSFDSREGSWMPIIVDCAVELHRNVGPGLFKTVSEMTLA